MTDPLWITEADAVSLMHLGQAVDALEAGLKLEAAGTAQNMEKTHTTWGGGHTLHAIGAAIEGAQTVGVKTWAHTNGGATPLLILWNSETGALEAIIEAFALGQMRTAAMSGLATRWMAAAQADELAIIGTGKQALPQVAAVASVRRLKRIRIFSPSAANRSAFAERVAAGGFECEVKVCASVAEATRGASIITLVTRATESFLEARHVPPGAHINAVGAIAPDREEFGQDIFARADWIAVDALASVRRLSREFIRNFEEGPGDWRDVQGISAIVSARETRPPGADISLFKAMGMGISDLSLGIQILDRAHRQGRGRPIPHPEKVRPRLTPDQLETVGGPRP